MTNYLHRLETLSKVKVKVDATEPSGYASINAEDLETRGICNIKHRRIEIMGVEYSPPYEQAIG